MNTTEATLAEAAKWQEKIAKADEKLNNAGQILSDVINQTSVALDAFQNGILDRLNAQQDQLKAWRNNPAFDRNDRNIELINLWMERVKIHQLLAECFKLFVLKPKNPTPPSRSPAAVKKTDDEDDEAAPSQVPAIHASDAKIKPQPKVSNQSQPNVHNPGIKSPSSSPATPPVLTMHNLQVAIGAFFSSGKDGDGSFPVFLSWAANFYIVTPECRTGAFKDEFERIKKALEMK